MVVEVVIGVNECADDIEGVKCVTGEAVTETDLSCTGTECFCPLCTCGSVEYNVDLVFQSGALGQVIQNVLQVGSSKSLLIGIGRRTVNQSDVLRRIVAVLLGICKQNLDSSINSLLL